MAIDMVRMPPELSNGFAKQLDFKTAVVRLDFGGREAVRTLEMPRRYWQARKGVFSLARIEEFVGFIQARAGALHGFRFWDPSDCSTNPTSRHAAPSMLDQFLGYGDGVETEFELRRVYASTASDFPQRRAVDDRMIWLHDETDDRLAKCLGLAAGTVFNSRFAFGVTEQTGFTMNPKTRTVTFATAPGVGIEVFGGGYYDWPVALGEDSDANFETMVESWTAQSAPNIELECLPFERLAPDTDDPGGAFSFAWQSSSPLLQKWKSKVWFATPDSSGQSVTLEEPSELNSGGPHFIIKNGSATNSFEVRDELTGSVIVAIPATQTGWFFVEIQGATRNWFYVLT